MYIRVLPEVNMGERDGRTFLWHSHEVSFWGS